MIFSAFFCSKFLFIESEASRKKLDAKKKWKVMELLFRLILLVAATKGIQFKDDTENDLTRDTAK